jgi:hypothetical protein
MRRLLILALAAGLAVCNSGCLINVYSSDPNKRILELLTQSENLRNIQSEWERLWLVDQPSHLTYERIHGGLQ